MSDFHRTAASTDADEREDTGDAAVRALVKRALGPDGGPLPTPDLLPGVQRRIRLRSRGKFFADGWSTTQSRLSYTLAGLMTLALAVLAYLVLAPTAFH
jgi:hypothetical protein